MKESLPMSRFLILAFFLLLSGIVTNVNSQSCNYKESISGLCLKINFEKSKDNTLNVSLKIVNKSCRSIYIFDDGVCFSLKNNKNVRVLRGNNDFYEFNLYNLRRIRPFSTISYRIVFNFDLLEESYFKIQVVFFKSKMLNDKKQIFGIDVFNFCDRIIIDSINCLQNKELNIKHNIFY
jgi:hypothetical protein